jgi:hypothetical protein
MTPFFFFFTNDKIDTYQKNDKIDTCTILFYFWQKIKDNSTIKNLKVFQVTMPLSHIISF